ncbi:MAG: hypothetical protein ACE5OQ_08275 [Woeseia sp.]
MSTGLRSILLSSLLLTAVAADAARTDIHVPDELQSWTGWILQDQAYRECPFFFNQRESKRTSFICAWPDRLDLRVNGIGGSFSQSWTVYQTDEWVPLPGSAAVWPQRVTANGQAVEVVMRGSSPKVRLTPGRYNIAGRFEWQERPRTLDIPRETGLIELFLDGNRVSRPDWSQSAVWLGEREQHKKMQDAVNVQVYRLVSDDIPTRLATNLTIEVAGSVREELIGPTIPEGFVPLALDSELPARLEPDGNLRLQVRPGRWKLSLLARAPGVLNSLTLAVPQHNLPISEIWSYRSSDRLRVTAPEAPRPVDPIQASVPDDWAELPAFRLESGESLTIAERSRGKVVIDNDLSLDRLLWLDFDGDGFVFSDQVGGTMRSAWRLDMAAPYELLSAVEAGENILVTNGDHEGLAGVELRRADVDLYALGRSETRGAMPVTGWQSPFNRVDTSLNLPPGHQLIAAIGADHSPASWVDHWKLLDFFLVLIITITAGRLFGRRIGVIALFALTISAHEFGAPAWTWLNMLAVVALVRVAPEGRLIRFLKAYRGFSFVLLLVLLVPFVAGQLRIAIFPQLESQISRPLDILGRRITPYGAGDAFVPGDRASRIVPGTPAEAEAPRAAMLEETVVTGARALPDVRFARYAPNAVVQAGPGRPSWRWNQYQLSWTGPVDPERTMRLVVMPRWLVSGVRLIEVLLIAAFAAAFAFEILDRDWKWPGGISKKATAAASLALLMGTGALFGSPAAMADTPSPAVLQELEKRLLAPPPCRPNCAEIVDADVNAGDEFLTVDLELHALEEVAVPLPGSLQGWRPEQIQLNRSPARQVFRDGNDVLWVRVSEGRHHLTLRGPIPPADSLELPFPLPPRVIRARSDAWFIAGIKDRSLLSGSLQLTRLQQQSAGDSTARWESSRFPVFVRIEREIFIDLDWQVRTTVYRIAPEQGALTLQIPLLAGESIITEEFTAKDESVLVSMNPKEEDISWRSTLPRQSPMTLQANGDGPWKEVWRFAVGSIWRADFGGVPESELEYDAGDARVAEFYPRPGESLTLIAARPEARPGTTLAFDSVQLQTLVGERSRSADLNLAYRSTRGSQHAIRLPDGAEIRAVTIDGKTEPLHAKSGELTIPILPGEHSVQIAWRDHQEVGYRATSPDVDLGAAASNIKLSVELPRNRWVLATGGPRLGPAVVYWSELAALILFALILGRTTMTPLDTRHWVLLGMGFSTFSWTVLGVVVLWLLAAGARRNWKPDVLGWRFNALQVIFAIVTVIALASIVGSLPTGLLGTPDMHVAGNGSAGNTLRWFADRSDTVLPGASVLSLPIWTYKVLILAWALWLSFALLKWLPWVWKCFTCQGLWHSRRGLELSQSADRES